MALSAVERHGLRRLIDRHRRIVAGLAPMPRRDETAEAIVRVLQEHGTMTARDLALAAGLPVQGVAGTLRGLKKDGTVEMKWPPSSNKRGLWSLSMLDS